MWENGELIKMLKEGGVAVMPTDTIYGLSCSAFDPLAVERVYAVKKRNPEKPCIILIGDAQDLKAFGMKAPIEAEEYWPGPVSIILDCPDESFSYLHRGTKSISVRLPDNDGLRRLISHTGPLISTSANTEGMPPAKNIDEAKKYFGNNVDIYVDGGEIGEKHSRLIRLKEGGGADIIRE